MRPVGLRCSVLALAWGYVSHGPSAMQALDVPSPGIRIGTLFGDEQVRDVVDPRWVQLCKKSQCDVDGREWLG